ncbi:MAG: hypothetical protein HC929_20450 [Leptolyngbyaceae cyanobacterium SM2_5_2]|nr:hypothetical protein [Leptolyngbyaceae cyanobacterium SM2_5_2]
MKTVGWAAAEAFSAAVSHRDGNGLGHSTIPKQPGAEPETTQATQARGDCPPNRPRPRQCPRGYPSRLPTLAPRLSPAAAYSQLCPSPAPGVSARGQKPLPRKLPTAALLPSLG